MFGIFEEINYFRFDSAHRPLSLEISGVSYCDGSYRIFRKKSPISVIEYIEKGRGTVIFDGKKYTAEKGDVYLLPAGTRHEYFSSSDDPWIKKFFNINGSLFLNLLRDYSLDNVVVIKNCDVKNLFDEIYEYSCLKKDNIDEFYDTLTLKLHELLIKVKNQAEIKPQNDEMLKLKQYIDNNLDKIVSNDELSSIIFRSNDYVIKTFYNCFGNTPYDYQLEQKLTASKRLLQYTQLSIGEISQRLGYTDQHYFSNLFKKKCGMSPLKYRKTKK